MKTLRIGVLLLTPLTAFATTMVALDLPALSRVSDTIVQGTVKSITGHLSRDGRRVSTQIEIQVNETLKGQPPQTIVVTQPGGVSGDIGQLVSGTAHYELGEEVVLFLEKYGPRFRTVGMAQGKYKVERSTDGKAAFATPDSEAEALLLDPATHLPVSKSGATLKLETFKAQIHTALAPPQKGTGL